MKVSVAPLRCSCDGRYFANEFTYDAPPDGEVQFQFSSSGTYHREVNRCELCGHFVSVHEMDAGALYAGDYVSSNYRDDEGIRRSFERVISLDPAQSDNAGRVERVLEFASAHFAGSSRGDRALSILDVGSGLCVFVHQMKGAGWDCTALDPDIRSVDHARKNVGVKAVCADFMDALDLGRFDAVTFNKVLEHVHDPVAMLVKGGEHLREGGFIYLEVPDGEAAALEGPGREEFFIDHPHVFSAGSLATLSVNAGFTIQALERLHEPSGKYTLRAFLMEKPAGQG